MPPLKAIEQAEFGGVDSRSNPVVMPQNRFLRLRNWLPRPDGHLELRDGYTLQVAGAGYAGSGPIHSVTPYTAAYPNEVAQTDAGLPFTNGAECIFFWIGKVPYVRRLDGATNPTHSPTIKGNPIASSARWSYALGKNGYLFMHNGTDKKFFDGLYLRDIGLPVITQTQARIASVIEGLSAPSSSDVDSCTFTWVAPTDPAPTQANAASGYMYMAYFNKNNDVLAPSPEPLSGGAFLSGHDPANTLGYASSYLEVQNLPPPQDSNGDAVPGAVTLLYYPQHVLITLLPGTQCQFYIHDGATWAGQFEYKNAADPAAGGWPTLPVTHPPGSHPFNLNNTEGILFNPGDGQPFFGWTGNTTGATYPMVVANVKYDNTTKQGKYDAAKGTAAIWSGAGSGAWAMTVEGKISVPAPGNYDFIFVHDDGAILGIGDGAVSVVGTISPGIQTMTADHGYPLMSGQNVSAIGAALYDKFTVNFPTAGTYHFEIDFCNWHTEQTCCLYNGDGSVLLPQGIAPAQPVNASSPSYLTEDYGQDGATLSAVSATKVNVNFTAHGLADRDVIVLALHKHPSKTDYPTPYGPVTWDSNGPFTITYVDPDNFTFNTTDSSPYAGATPITFYHLVEVDAPTTDYIINTDNTGWPKTCQNDRDTNQNGQILLPSPTDLTIGDNLIPASAIGGAQPGYQFYVSIYNPRTGHVGNRIPIGPRIANKTPCVFDLSGLPDLSAPFSGNQVLCWGNATEPAAVGIIPKPNQGDLLGYETSPGDSEWCLLIGRTGDGGEVPYAVIDSNGNWVYAQPAQSDITIDYANIDGNSELPTENYIPPAFSCFWREGDRQCGSIAKQPFVFNSGSELDDTTGIFVGDPAQSWSPIKVETFPSAQPVWGGFGYMQESWVFTKGQCGQLSELSGERAWNGPYNFSVIGPHAFDGGWNHLPFWVSHQKQLCTMLPNANGPMAISTEYDAALLQQIGPEPYASQTEVIYFRDPLRLIEILRIKCIDKNGDPFVVVHDFNMRDDLSPYGQAYREDYQDILSSDFTTARVRADDGEEYMWAGTSNGRFAQFYTGGDDNGVDFVADGICLRYIGGDRTAVKTVEWYGDEQIKWYVKDSMVGVTTDPNTWTEVSFEMRPFPGDESSAHYQADVQRPEMIHCYFWIQLTSHSEDAVDPTNPKALSDPPHLPLETYGRLYLSAPILGDTRGR